jgi:hypothetical protein
VRNRFFLLAVGLFVVVLSGFVVTRLVRNPASPDSAPSAPSSEPSSVISYQGVLNNANGQAVTGIYSMTYRLYNTPDGITPLWTEYQPSVSVVSGLFSVYLGDFTPLTQTIFTRQALYLGVTVSTDSEMTPRTRIATVPYAFTSAATVACIPGNSICNGACYNLNSDPTHCGSCGIACAVGASCTSGVCGSCPVGQTNCSNVCRDLQTDPNSCGTCGHACVVGHQCVSGVCN